LHAEKSRDDVDVAVSDLMVFVPFGRLAFVSVSVCDGIALKQYFHMISVLPRATYLFRI
jgi:hypothetical protein